MQRVYHYLTVIKHTIKTRNLDKIGRLLNSELAYFSGLITLPIRRKINKIKDNRYGKKLNSALLNENAVTIYAESTDCDLITSYSFLCFLNEKEYNDYKSGLEGWLEGPYYERRITNAEYVKNKKIKLDKKV